ncbi:Uncharacterised protein [Serratia quinivorans]|nr:Uncharacterised protein [Serratia quinivorans]
MIKSMDFVLEQLANHRLVNYLIYIYFHEGMPGVHQRFRDSKRKRITHFWQRYVVSWLSNNDPDRTEPGI